MINFSEGYIVGSIIMFMCIYMGYRWHEARNDDDA
jgi:hypothetical protein